MTVIPQPLVTTQQQQFPVTTYVNGSVLAVTAITTAAKAALSANSTRQKIVFHNPNTDGTLNNNLLVYPVKDMNGAALAPTFAAPGGGFVIFPGASLEIAGVGSVGTAWNVLASGGTLNGLTMFVQ